MLQHERAKPVEGRVKMELSPAEFEWLEPRLLLSWTPPIGIPTPAFGIEEAHTMYAGQLFDYGSGDESYRDAGNGPYTHYVDNTHPNATDSSNPYGTPTRPRMTMPTTLAAGSIVELHGGPYTTSDNYVIWRANGTEDKPVFIRGADAATRPILSLPARVSGTYLILENLEFTGTAQLAFHGNYSQEYMAIRQSEFHDMTREAIWIGAATNIVVYDNYLHDNGDVSSSAENDIHGVLVWPDSEQIWIVDNHMHHNAGDSIQITGGQNAASARYIYIGRNEMHHDRENAIDIKGSRHVIISQNEMYGYRTCSSSDGTALVGGHEGAQLTWILFNEIYDSTNGIRVNEPRAQEVAYIIGNLIHDIHHDGPESHGRAIVTWYNDTLHIVNNTIYDVDEGFYSAASVATYYVANNIFADLADPGSRYFIRLPSDDIAANSTLRHNLFYQDDGPVRIRWSGDLFDDVASFVAAFPDKGEGSVGADPLLADPENGNLHLAPGSPAIDVADALEYGYYVDLFYSMYGLDIAVDFDGKARPTGPGLDMGAFEVGGTLPVANDDTADTVENTPVVIDVVLNDSDGDGDPLAITAVTQPAHGTVVNNGDGTLTYTPDTDWHGQDSFTYTITDNNDGADTATVAVTVGAGNDNPVAGDDTAVTTEDNPVTTGDVLANDSDPNLDPLTITEYTQGSHGSVVHNGDGTFTYTPDANWYGQDSFTYAVSDGNGGSDSATVSITVGSVNDVPVAREDALATDEDIPASVGVLSNDGDADGDALTVTGFTQAAHGSVVNNGGGSFIYTPDTNWYGQDSFTYTVSDGNGGTDTATVTVTVSPVNDAPVAGDDAAATDEDTPVDLSVLDNDTDVDGDGLVVAGFTEPADGTVVDNGDGSLTYTPEANWHGQDSFTYTISDANGGSDSATVSITVGSVNDVPAAGDDLAATNMNTSVTIDVLDNDADADGDALTVTDFTQPAHGTVVNNGGGSFTYTPDTNWYGQDSFTYTVSDGNGGTDTATVSVTVGNGNENPVAGNDTLTTAEDTPAIVDVLANDTDANEDALYVIDYTEPSHGSLVHDGSGVFTYMPDANWHGQDAFTYLITDGKGGADSGAVSITVESVNDVPVAGEDALATDEDTPASVGVLSNDGDADSDTLTVIGFTQPAHGTVVDNGGGSFTYTPDTNWYGQDSFTYTVSDGNGGTDTAAVHVTVTAVNDDPQPNPDSMSTDEDMALMFTVDDLLGNDTDVDGDAVSFLGLAEPAHGTVVDEGQGTFTYLPDANWHGQDSFTYAVTDGNGPMVSATVTITVRSVEDVPVAGDDTLAADEDTPATVDVLSNDSDGDGDWLTVTDFTNPAHGTVVDHGDGTFTYTPDANWYGQDSFTYTVSDGNGGTDTAAVQVTVTAVNDDPQPNPDLMFTDEDTPLDFLADDLLANDTDVDGDALELLSLNQPLHGRLVATALDAFKYTPDADWYGRDTFEYAVMDGNGGLEWTTAEVTVRSVNDDPVAREDTAVTGEESAVDIDLLANDDDVDGDTLTVVGFTQPAHGGVVYNGDGTMTYTPDVGYYGEDSFTYTVSDGSGGQDVGGVAVTVENIAISVGKNESQTFHDANGELVKVTLKGPGSAELHFLEEGASDLRRIVLDGTSARSTLLVVTSGTGSSTTIGDIIINGTLNALTAKTTELLGDLTVKGFLRTLELSDTADQHIITIGPSLDARETVAMTFGRVAELSIYSAIPIRSIVATDWVDADGTPDVIEAPSMAKLMIRGNARDGVAGDFQADLILDGSAGDRLTLGNAKIAGSLTDATWDITGDVGAINVAGEVDGWTLDVHSQVRSLTLGNVVAADVTVDGNIGAVRAWRWVGGNVAARTLRSLMVPGHRKLGLAGDFGAGLALSGGQAAQTLRAAGIRGSVNSAAWSIVGHAGTIRVDGDVDNWNLDVQGDLRSLKLGDVAGAYVNVRGWLKTAFATRWLDGAIKAGTLTSLTARGNSKKGIRGDFGADLLLTGGTAGLTLGKVNILGNLSGADWSVAGKVGTLVVKGAAAHSKLRASGSIKKIILGATESSDFLAGVRSDLQGDVTDSNDFVNPLAEIQSIKIVGLKSVNGEPVPRFFYRESNFFAARFGKIELLNVDFDGQEHGLHVPQADDGVEIRSITHRDTVTHERWSWSAGNDGPPPFADVLE